MMTTTTEYHYLTFEEPVAAEDVPTTTIQRQNYPTAELRAPPPLEDLLQTTPSYFPGITIRSVHRVIALHTYRYACDR
eukprot:1399619-Pyramimonas_sp.AAC.5